MRSGLLKYKIGLSVLALGVAGLVVFVLVQAGTAKKDTDTARKAQVIGAQLDAYISEQEKIPQSLSEANIADVPATITYRPLSESQYEFCVTYKGASSGVDSSTLIQDAMMRSYGVSPTEQGTRHASSVYITEGHKKGQNCQTVEPALYNYNDYNNYFPSDSQYDSSDSSIST